MSRMIYAFLFLLCGCMGALLGIFASGSASGDSDSLPRIGAGSEAGGDTGDQDLDALWREVARLRAEQARQRIGMAAVQDMDGERATEGTADMDMEEPDMDELVARERAQGQRRAAAITAAAGREAEDPAWAPAMERQIAETFAAHAPPGSRLLLATCKSSICIAEFEHASRRHSKGMLGLRRISDLPRGFVVQHEPTSGGSYRTVAYLARAGHALPR